MKASGKTARGPPLLLAPAVWLYFSQFNLSAGRSKAEPTKFLLALKQVKMGGCRACEASPSAGRQYKRQGRFRLFLGGMLKCHTYPQLEPPFEIWLFI